MSHKDNKEENKKKTTWKKKLPQGGSTVLGPGDYYIKYSVQ